MSLFFDTSGLAKLYHDEAGSTTVESLLEKGQSVILSRLGALEMHSVFAGKVRTGVLTQADADLALQLFRSDIRKRRFNVVALRVRHYELAQKLVAAHGTSAALRTLDSLQLAVALDLSKRGIVNAIVTADKTMIKVAATERLLCIDPTTATSTS